MIVIVLFSYLLFCNNMVGSQQFLLKSDGCYRKILFFYLLFLLKLVKKDQSHQDVLISFLVGLFQFLTALRQGKSAKCIIKVITVVVSTQRTSTIYNCGHF